MLKKSILLFLAAISTFSFVKAQEQSIQRTFKLVTQAKSYYEGFQQLTGTNEFSYQSLRDDVTASMLTRCTDGNMAIEWKTAVLPSEILSDGAGFMWLAAVDHTTEGKKFNVYINGQPRFTFISSGQQEREFSGEEGSRLGFTTVSSDQHGDFHGYMWTWLPKSWLIAGKSQTIKIVGEAAGSNSWIIVYQANDALAYLRNSAKYSTWAEINAEPQNNGYKVVINAPTAKSGEQITVEFAKEKRIFQLAANDKCSQ